MIKNGLKFTNIGNKLSVSKLPVYLHHKHSPKNKKAFFTHSFCPAHLTTPMYITYMYHITVNADSW